ncbi:peptidoglycan-binding domain-containing protein [Jannaschia sp. LMIT008]|uniref:peptidoglycan-binding domain-containing protein n=1 Tax=Jannaschia maritima TaxID=3032585 RepID=UPI002810DDDF|nr:peptidoglycan-binding domain-containing protein [Jannaschia sp. LMIT008]
MRRLQVGLNAMGHHMPRSTIPGGGFDGAYGREMDGIVTALQRSTGLTVDGIAGRQVVGHVDAKMRDLETALASLAPALDQGTARWDGPPIRANAGRLSPESVARGTSPQCIVQARTRLLALRQGNVSYRKPVWTHLAQTTSHDMVNGAAALPVLVGLAAALFEALAGVQQALWVWTALCAAATVTVAVVPKAIDEIAAMASQAERMVRDAVGELEALLAAYEGALGPCAHHLKDLIGTLWLMIKRTAREGATRPKRMCRPGDQWEVDRNVLKDIKDLTNKAIRHIEALLNCLADRGIITDDAATAIFRWLERNKRLSLKVGWTRKVFQELTKLLW